MQQLFVGLGNPTTEYSLTRHNVGFWLIEQLAKQENLTFKLEKKFKSLVAIWQQSNKKIYLCLPQTYMNNSGHAVRLFMDYYNIPVENITVFHDELDFPVGTVKLKHGGGNGGHNGLSSITNHLGSADYNRVRMGIDHPGYANAVSKYVLSCPSVDDKMAIQLAIDFICNEIDLIAKSQWQLAMQVIHSKVF